MPDCYLTIDDSPSPHTDAMIDYLEGKGIPALLFCRGDMMERWPDAVVRAIQKGFVIGNHSYSHPRFSTISFGEAVEEIEKTETLIDRAYAQAGRERPGRYFRFPHMDSGAGGYVVDYDALPAQHRETVKRLFAEGVNIAIEPPSESLRAHQARLNDYLRNKGFIQPFTSVTYPWYVESGLDASSACLYTFSTADWMMLDRHWGRWPYKSVADLKDKIDTDPWLKAAESRAVILIHDKVEPEIFPVFKSLIDHMVLKGYHFVDFSKSQTSR